MKRDWKAIATKIIIRSRKKEYAVVKIGEKRNTREFVYFCAIL